MQILLLDEATASVDPETDATLQATLHAAFPGATTLTIAHRLHTVADSDRVLVMAASRVAELGTPAALLEDKKSLYSQLVGQASGSGLP